MTLILAGTGQTSLQPVADYLAQQFSAAVQVHDSPTAALRAVQTLGKNCEVLVADMANQTMTGALSFLQAVHTAQPELPIVVLATVEQAEQSEILLRAGAMDVLAKPVPRNRLRIVVLNARRMFHLRMQARLALMLEHAVPTTLLHWQAENPRMRHMLMQAQTAAVSHAPIWIQGEYGTGRQQLARAIHASSSHAAYPFESVACETMPELALERLLFGGNSQRSQCALQRAQGGTLYIDAADALPRHLWPRLLSEAQHSVRLIFASTRPLLHFQALFSQLAHSKIHALTVPPLRERPEDIGQLAEHSLARCAAIESVRMPLLRTDAHAWLAQQPWGGNLPELGRLMHRLVVRHPGVEVDRTMLEQLQHDAALTEHQAHQQLHGATMPTGVLPVLDTEGKIRPMADVENDLLRFALEHSEGCMARAARALGIGRSTLYRKLYDRADEQPKSA